MIQFIAQAHDPAYAGPIRVKPVTDQFPVWAKDEREAATKALSMARQRAKGNFRQVSILGVSETGRGRS